MAQSKRQARTGRSAAEPRNPRWARIGLVWVLVAAWLIGSAAMINSVVNRARFNAIPEWLELDSWGTVFAVVLGLGVLRGALHYGVGGLWVRLKLLICGVRGGQWGTATRLFCLTRLPEQLASMALLVYFAVAYHDLSAYLAQPLGIANLIAASVMLATPFLTYAAARSAYRGLWPVWTALLFFLLPLSWRAAVVVILLAKLLVPGLIPGPPPTPDVEHSRHFVSARFEFDYPGNWGVEDVDQDDRRIKIYADRGTAQLMIWTAPIAGPDVVEASFEDLRKQGYQAQLVDEQQGVTLGSQTGYGLEHKLTKSGRPSRMFHFIMQIGPEHLAVFRYHAGGPDWNSGKLAAMQIIDSVTINGFSGQKPDLVNPELIERDWFMCRVPGNWTISDRSHEQYRSFVIQPEQGGRFWCSIFDRSVSSDKELETYIEYSLWHETIERRDELDAWFGMEGAGADLTCREPLLGMQRVRAIYVPLADGRVVGIRVEQPESTAATTDPGFALVERTFELRGVEPATP